MNDSSTFDAQYTEYLSLIREMDIDQKADILGIQKRNQVYLFEFFNRQILFDGDDFKDMSGEAVPQAIKTVLCKYLILCPDSLCETSNRLVTFREFSNAGPLFSNFTANTGKIIETTFSGRIENLTARCQKLGGTLMEKNAYDMTVRFRALHRVPVILNFNDTEDSMPAKAGFLYHDNADQYLDLVGLTLTCTYLTGLLIRG